MGVPPAVHKLDDSNRLSKGLQDLYQRGEFVDVNILCADRTFGAHRAVLAAQSEVFKQGLVAKEGAAAEDVCEVRLAEIANPESVKFMLDYMYSMDSAVLEEYNPRTQEINKDVLQLAQNFKLPGLAEKASYWLAKDLTTGNVVEP